MSKDKKKMLYNSKECVVKEMLSLIGEDPSREGLRETPRRVVAAWDEWFSGYKVDPNSLFKTFEDGAEEANDVVLVKNIPVMSFCEHHITPFIGHAHIAYIPNKNIVGLSKLPRVVDAFSRRLQVQERLTNQIADCIRSNLDAAGVAVLITAKHLCMCTRGVNMPGIDTTTIAVRGAFCLPQKRQEFLNLCKE